MADVSLLSAAELAAIRMRADQATPGPWQHRDQGDIYVEGSTTAIAHRDVGGSDADADFIAAARMVAMLERMDASESGAKLMTRLDPRPELSAPRVCHKRGTRGGAFTSQTTTPASTTRMIGSDVVRTVVTASTR
jgi:hypothetical protein